MQTPERVLIEKPVDQAINPGGWYVGYNPSTRQNVVDEPIIVTAQRPSFWQRLESSLENFAESALDSAEASASGVASFVYDQFYLAAHMISNGIIDDQGAASRNIERVQTFPDMVGNAATIPGKAMYYAAHPDEITAEQAGAITGDAVATLLGGKVLGTLNGGVGAAAKVSEGMLTPREVAGPIGREAMATDSIEAPFSPIVDGGGLQAHENAGGHLLLKHVGQTEQDLMTRLTNEPKISGSSSFYDRATAESAVSQALDANQTTISDWLNGTSGRLRIDYTLPDPVGISVSRGATGAVDVNSSRIILVRDPSMPTGYKILTGFPTK
ncbi:RNase A-like domain-containing protein [Amantichitinum ursilacus]|uniref:RNase A-like domain-containing protein n=1 Tax=Amantichitinum ursilacus TaxID=857265 RepID=UPI00128F9A1E|nr:RNase A-like domain-containing protein [Amantichitinum ursilacus]